MLDPPQELQADLRQVMHLRQRSAEYQLSHYGSNGAQYVRHRDAFPDDGSEEQQRRVLTTHPFMCGDHNTCRQTHGFLLRAVSSRIIVEQQQLMDCMVTLQVTAILYANPNWCPADGGKLRLWPPRTVEATSSLSSVRASLATGGHTSLLLNALST